MRTRFIPCPFTRLQRSSKEHRAAVEVVQKVARERAQGTQRELRHKNASRPSYPGRKQRYAIGTRRRRAAHLQPARCSSSSDTGAKMPVMPNSYQKYKSLYHTRTPDLILHVSLRGSVTIQSGGQGVRRVDASRPLRRRHRRCAGAPSLVRALSA